MLTKRIIPCLDVKDGRTVKGVNFVSLRDAGDPVELAQRYAQEGADELVFLDISASEEKRKTLAQLVRHVAQAIDIPFTVGGGISSVEDVGVLLDNGADKVSINSAAVRRPELISELAQRFGTQCIVVAIDAKQIEDEWVVHLVGGKVPTERRLFEWATEAVARGAGELLFTSMDHDGTKQGFANAALKKLPYQEVTEKGPFTISNTTEKISMRARGRQARIRVSCDSTGTSWRWGSLRMALQKDGGR